MRIIRLLVLISVLVFGIWVADQHQPFGSQVPAMGPLLSPFTGFWQQADPVEPAREKRLSFPALSGEASVYFDERMVPHIFAANEEDAAFIQGYMTASDRLWQMDIAVRATSGRLAEVLGENLLERDKIQRRKGILRTAERITEEWKKNESEWAILIAYARGINSYVASLSPADYPLEFKLMGYKPEAWAPVKSAIFFLSMAETLCSRQFDVPASNTLALLGRDTFNFLFPEWNPKQSPIIPSSVEWNFTWPDTSGRDQGSMLGQTFPVETFPLPPEFIGSNNWAVSGSKTASGYPILCNDPHLRLTVPAIWYEIQICAPGYNAYGVSLPGIPGIAIGFNESIAWGETNVGQDVMDWYAIKWVEGKKGTYLLDGQEREVEQVVEVIKVRDKKEPVLDTVSYTRWGPIVYESEDAPYAGLAMRWTVHDTPRVEPHSALGTFMNLMKGKNYKDYYEALKGYENPPQNFVFASKDGDIAITVNGKLPIKQKEQGRFVQDGSSTLNAWPSFIPYEQLPRVKNPERGFVASANQHSTAPDYPYYYNGNFDDYRGRLINQRLAQMSDVKVEDMMALQLESHSLKAEDALPVLIDLVDTTAQALLNHEVMQLLRKWDYRFKADSKVATLFEMWYRQAYDDTFDELIKEEETLEVLLPEHWRFIEILDRYPAHPVFDHSETAAVENASQIVTAALAKVLEKTEQGIPIWGTYQAKNIIHLGRIDAFAAPLTAVGGEKNAPNAYTGRTGPSWRMVVALGPELKAYGVYPGGQSGNPGSPYYQNMVEAWANGEYYDLLFFKNADEAGRALEHSLIFEPQL
jgi:penicillin amidase